ncbi:vegetative cell wall protein gp1-like [Abeliophyllum distichum]|uniref:Vegetative cell wall protein gp1-like n=1 Tax=Abeliophyllum distichum TaxID=126358 RepID=A0ABD1V9V6_9LAMI
MVPPFPFPRPNPTPLPLVPPPPPNHPIRSKDCRIAYVHYDSCNPLPPDVSNASHMNPFELHFKPPYDNIDVKFEDNCCMASEIITNNCIDAIRDMSYGELRIYYHLANMCSFQISQRSKRS